MIVEPFRVNISDGEIEELRGRVRATRWPRHIPAPAWSAGADHGVVKRLADHWASAYDWRFHEAAMNELPHYLVEIDGTRVHFIHLRGEGDSPFPIVLTHGWPSSFLELVTLGDRLAHPSRFGGRPEDSFDVVIPSLPGFAFSAQRPDLCRKPTHELWFRLMRDALGYRRFGAHGGDLGAGVTARLAAAYPNIVAGIHLLAVPEPHVAADEPLTSEERVHREHVTRWTQDEGAYGHQQATRPVTLGYGLSDSPVGLLAWIVEKYQAWSDCNGDLSTRFSDDDILTQVSLYWYTNSITTSFRPYFEHRYCPAPPIGRVDVPTAVALFPGDLSHPPRSWAERTLNVTRYSQMPRGGHFAAHEEPELLAADLRAFFRTVR